MASERLKTLETALPQQHPSIPLTQPDSLSVRVPSSLSLKQTTHTALRPSTDKQERERERERKREESSPSVQFGELRRGMPKEKAARQKHKKGQ